MNNNQPLVSIIVNNYNYGRFLGKAIDSALDQTYPRTEVIIVDDGSTDESREVIYKYEDRIISVLKENGGQASAFNVGLSTSKGDIIIFLDSDDYLFPNAVEEVVAAWEPGITKVQYRLEVIDHNNQAVSVYPPPTLAMDSGEVLPILLTKGKYVSPVTSGNAFSREVLNKIFPVPEVEFRICADAYVVNLAPFYGKILSIEKPLGAYRVHGNNSWAPKNFGLEWFRKSVVHDLQKFELIRNKAKELNHQVSKDLDFQDYNHLRLRIASLRLEPENHPVPSDSLIDLALRGVSAVWNAEDLSLKKRLILIVWFLWVGLLPLPIAKLAISRIDPQSGFRPLSWIVKKLRFQPAN